MPTRVVYLIYFYSISLSIAVLKIIELKIQKDEKNANGRFLRGEKNYRGEHRKRSGVKFYFYFLVFTIKLFPKNKKRDESLELSRVCY